MLSTQDIRKLDLFPPSGEEEGTYLLSLIGYKEEISITGPPGCRPEHDVSEVDNTFK
jgi:hypothetical protein